MERPRHRRAAPAIRVVDRNADVEMPPPLKRWSSARDVRELHRGCDKQGVVRHGLPSSEEVRLQAIGGEFEIDADLAALRAAAGALSRLDDVNHYTGGWGRAGRAAGH